MPIDRCHRCRSVLRHLRAVHWLAMTLAAIISKPQKAELGTILPELRAWLAERGWSSILDPESAAYFAVGEVEGVAARGDGRAQAGPGGGAGWRWHAAGGGASVCAHQYSTAEREPGVAGLSDRGAAGGALCDARGVVRRDGFDRGAQHDSRRAGMREWGQTDVGRAERRRGGEGNDCAHGRFFGGDRWHGGGGVSRGWGDSVDADGVHGHTTCRRTGRL